MSSVHSIPDKLALQLFGNLPGAPGHGFLGAGEQCGSFELNRSPARAEGVWVASEAASITCSVSWGLERQKVLQGYKGFKAWSL